MARPSRMIDASSSAWDPATIPPSSGVRSVSQILDCPASPLPVVTPSLIPLPDHVAEPARRERLDPLLCFFGVSRDAVEEGSEQLRRAEPHVLVGLVDQQLVSRELVGRDVAEPL